MTKHPTDKEKDEHDRQIEREARMGRKFSMEDALFMSGGGGMMKGGTPLAPYEEAEHQIEGFLNRQLHDAVMEKSIENWIGLHRKVFEKHLEHPTQGLLEIIERTLTREASLLEFVRTVDFYYGQMMQERPRFQQAGDPPHPDDAYTIASVRQTLTTLAEACRASRPRRG